MHNSYLVIDILYVIATHTVIRKFATLLLFRVPHRYCRHLYIPSQKESPNFDKRNLYGQSTMLGSDTCFYCI